MRGHTATNTTIAASAVTPTHVIVRLRCADTTWFAKLAPGALPRGVAPGQELPLAFDREHAWLFAA